VEEAPLPQLPVLSQPPPLPALDPLTAGGEASPVPLHAAVALLRARLLRGGGELPLSDELEDMCR